MNGAEANSRVKALGQLGQSVWLDYIRRRMLDDGTLARLIADDGVSGLTSNPAIFEKAIAGSDDYDQQIAALAADGANVQSLYEHLVLVDVAAAADLLRPTYDASNGSDGFVSIEVSPHLARDTAATVSEATALWQRLDRPNIMIKVPGTKEGLPAIRHLIADGVNVNITLLFTVSRYLEVADAWLSGLKQRAAAGRPVDNVASVASFFLSRIDTLVDARLDALGGSKARNLRGTAAIASATLAYARYRDLVSTPRWRALQEAGARPQRLLWASTSTKDPAYPDLKYVETLVAPDTVNTLPPETLDAFRDHGRAGLALDGSAQQAEHTVRALADLHIDLQKVGEQLEDEGIDKFVKPFDALFATLQQKQQTPA